MQYKDVWNPEATGKLGFFDALRKSTYPFISEYKHVCGSHSICEYVTDDSDSKVYLTLY